ATGQLFALGSSGQLYTLSPLTAIATKVGSPVMLTGTTYGVDFNPVPDRLRVVATNGQNLRLNPNDGTLAGTDTNIAFAMGDANQGKTPSITAVAYNNNFAGTPSTTLFGIDSGLDLLVTQGSPGGAPVSPNTGQLFTVGPLGVDVSDVAGFNVSDLSGIAY